MLKFEKSFKEELTFKTYIQILNFFNYLIVETNSQFVRYLQMNSIKGRENEVEIVLPMNRKD